MPPFEDEDAETTQLPEGTRLRSEPSFLTQLPASLLRQPKPELILPAIKKSASTPNLSSPKKLPAYIYSKRWTTETKRYLHQRRERRWLTLKQKHCYIDFSVEERAELRHYFDSLTGSNGLIDIENLEDMLISLGIANNKKEVDELVDKIDDLKTRELDFNQFLDLIRARSDYNTLRVFKDMMEGQLGDRHLDFRTVISEHRRKLILDASGSRSTSTEQQERGGKVLKNFADLKRSRYDALERDPEREALGLPPKRAGSKEPTFQVDSTQAAPMGGMKMCWRGVCTEHNLTPSRPVTPTNKTAERLESPDEVMARIEEKLSFKRGKKLSARPGTVIVQAPALNAEGMHRKSSAESVF
eukprot:TRINITY_DN79140_c0_g1_i1.p1 TRINITY_DN79140_c0_g1~~TRINITY_DN79140_c0_g1_i1.p1  ORF type:complete len:357 (+),score=78.63 TRINITY_DN79140_c0_g1_i1:110-1180(+)